MSLDEQVMIACTILSVVCLVGSWWLLHSTNQLLDRVKEYRESAEAMFDEVAHLADEIDPPTT